MTVATLMGSDAAQDRTPRSRTAFSGKLPALAESGSRHRAGSRFLPEDTPEDVGKATARFIAKVLARQVGPRM